MVLLSLDANSLVKAVKQAAMDVVEAKKPMAVVMGEVVKINPLQIRIDQKITLGVEQLILTNHVRDFRVRMRTPEIETDERLEDYSQKIDINYTHDHEYTDKYVTKVLLPEREEDYDRRYGLELEYNDNDPSKIKKTTAEENFTYKKDINIDLKHDHRVSFKDNIFTLRLGLQVGEKVILIRCDGGQQYIVLDRIGSDII